MRRERRLSTKLVDDLENHSVPEHFGLQISRMLFLVGRVANAKSGLLAKTAESIISRQRPPDTLVHHVRLSLVKA
jgi:hypothetical protein